MKFSEIQDLIKFVSKSGVSEVEIEDKDFKINIKTPPFRRGKGGEPQQVATHIIPQGEIAQAAPVAAAAPAPAAAAPAPAPAAAAPTPEEDKEANYIAIKSPMIGTFYRKASPDKPEFVKVGDSISPGDTVCVIEAMKLLNQIE